LGSEGPTPAGIDAGQKAAPAKSAKSADPERQAIRLPSGCSSVHRSKIKLVFAIKVHLVLPDERKERCLLIVAVSVGSCLKTLLQRGRFPILLRHPAGVGKTTIAAARTRGCLGGIRHRGYTVDPTRRLRDALGLEGLGRQADPNRRKSTTCEENSIPILKLSAMNGWDVKEAVGRGGRRSSAGPGATSRRIFRQSFLPKPDGGEVRPARRAFAGAAGQLYGAAFRRARSNSRWSITPPELRIRSNFCRRRARVVIFGCSIRGLAPVALQPPVAVGGWNRMKLASDCGARFSGARIWESEFRGGRSVAFEISDFFAAMAERNGTAIVDRLHKTRSADCIRRPFAFRPGDHGRDRQAQTGGARAYRRNGSRGFLSRRRSS